jgi:methylmalonyl-CoA mutase N-terminal domain/subunit
LKKVQKPKKNQILKEYSKWNSFVKSKSPVAEARTDSGVTMKLLYTPEDLAGFDYLTSLGFPGFYPFTRGVYPTMYRSKLWSMRQYAGVGTAEESNKRYHYLLHAGQTGLSVAFDLPTQLGYDSDHPLSEEEVGRVGVAIDTIDDMELLFQNIPLNEISVNFTINATAIVVLAMYVAIAKRQNIPLNQLKGTIQNDILKEYLSRNLYIFPPASSLRLIGDIIEYCSQYMPNFNPISISGFHYRERGANAIQEIAYTLSAAREYIKIAIGRGLDVDDFASRLSFQFASSRDFFEEIAKYRAARRLWARIMREEFKARKAESMRLRFFAGGSGISLTAREPLNNIVRTTLQCLEIVLGGGQSINVMTYDEALAIPTELSQKISLRTQQIIGYEAGVTRTVDPLAGSYFVESLTDQLEKKAVELLKKIKSLGGMSKAIEIKVLQHELDELAFEEEKKVQSGDKIMVGVNKFRSSTEDKQPITTYKPDPETTRRQLSRLSKTKTNRDSDVAEKCLVQIERAAMSNVNLVPFVVEAVEKHATIGEITETLRKIFGEYRE